MKKTLLVLLVTIIILSLTASFSLVGCKEEVAPEEDAVEEAAPEEEAEEAAQEEAAPEEEVMEPATITITSWNGGPHVASWETLIGVFNESYPNIEVIFEPIPGGEYNVAVAAELEIGEGHDIVQLRSFDMPRVLYEQGFLLELDDVVPELPNFQEVALNAWRTADRETTYGVPLVGVTHGIFYNEEMFAEYNLEEPKTWDEFINVCETFKENGIDPIALGSKRPWVFDVLLYGTLGANFYGGEESREKLVAGELKFTDSPFVSAFEACEQVVPYMMTGFQGLEYQDAMQLFLDGVAPMFMDGSWNLNTYESTGYDFTMGWFPGPVQNVGDDLHFAYHVDAALGVNKDTENLDAVLLFMNWIASPEFPEIYMNIFNGFYSWRTGEYNIEFPMAARQFELINNSLPTSRLTYEGLAAQDPSGTTLLDQALVDLFNGDFTAAEAAAYVQAGLDTWYEPFQK